MRRYKKPNSRKRKEARRARVRRIKFLRKLVVNQNKLKEAITRLATMDSFPIETLTKGINKNENDYKWDTNYKDLE